MKTILIYSIILFSGILLFGCNNPELSYEDNSNYNQWVFISLETVMKKDTTDYYFYAQINGKILDKINKNDISGYVILNNIRFINDSDKLQIYEDNIDQNQRIFRVKDIVKIELLKKDPLYTFNFDELADNAKKEFKNRK
jgi:hypothetical protein